MRHDEPMKNNEHRRKVPLSAPVETPSVAAKFMSQKELTRLGVEFCQLPYAIHRIMGD